MVIAPTALAQQSPSSSSSPSPTIETVATVNIENAKIASQINSTFTLSFDLTNRTGVQPQVKYGVVLTSPDGQTVIDERAYDTTISLGNNDVSHQTITYTAPAYVNGSYSLFIEAKNSDGLPFAVAPLGSVTLKGAAQYLEINPASCYLTVQEDATNHHYGPLEGVDVLNTEHLLAHCSVQNTFAIAENVVPTFKTYYRSIFGNVVATSPLPSIAIPANQTSALTFEIPKAPNPQAYDAVLSFNTINGSASNNVIFHYVLHGVSATIQNLVFDKDYYQSGNTAQVALNWTGTADTFFGSRLSGTDSNTLVAGIDVKDGQGFSCANHVSQSLDPNFDSVKLMIPITRTCLNPQATVTLQDNSGAMLAKDTFAIQSKNVPAQTTNQTTSAGAGTIILLVVLAAVAVVALVLNKKLMKGNA